METKANYVLAGLFIVISIIGAIIYSVFNSSWLNTNSVYPLDIYIKSSISGLNVGSQVLFNGIVIGKVNELSFNVNDLNSVVAHCSVEDSAPIRPSTIAELSYVGITGTVSINLRGGDIRDPLLFALAQNIQPYKTPMLYAQDAGINKLMSLSGTTLEQVNVTLKHIDKLLAEFHAPLNKSLNNIAKFSETLNKKSKAFDDLTNQSKITLNSIQKAANSINNMFSNSSSRGFRSLEQKLTNSAKTIDKIEQDAHSLSKNPQRIIWGNGRGDNVPIFGAGS